MLIILNYIKVSKIETVPHTSKYKFVDNTKNPDFSLKYSCTFMSAVTEFFAKWAQSIKSKIMSYHILVQNRHYC